MEDEHGALETSHSNFLLSVVGAVGSMLLFALIIAIAYVPNRPQPVNEDIVQQRKDNLTEVRAAQAKAADNYSWVNEQEGVVRIPISQAMQLTAQRLSSGEATQPEAKPTEKPAAAKPAAKETSAPQSAH